MNIDEIKNLKNARHRLENIIQKNDFESEIENELTFISDLKLENELKEVQRLLNSIHSNYSDFEEKWK